MASIGSLALISSEVPIKHASSSAYRIFQRVQRIAKQVFSCLALALCAPLRYCGAKDWSVPGIILRSPIVAFRKWILRTPSISVKRELFTTGLQRSASFLSADQAKCYVRYASACAGVQSGVSKWVSQFGMQTLDLRTFGLHELYPNSVCSENFFLDLDTGLKVMVSFDDEEAVFAFGALGSQKGAVAEWDLKRLNRKHYYGVFAGLLGVCPAVYDRADELYAKVRQHAAIRDKKVVCVGQCYGASIAQFVALKNDERAVCMNGWGIGAGLQQRIGKERLSRAEESIHHVSARTDFVSDNSLVAFFDRALSLSGIRTSGNFGKRKLIHTAYSTGGDTHTYFLGSLMQHIGRERRVLPCDLDAADPLLHQAPLWA